MPLDPVLVRGLTPISMPQPDPNAGVNQLGAIMKIQSLQNEMQANQLQAQKYQQDIASGQATERKARLESKINAFRNGAALAGEDPTALMGLISTAAQDPDMAEALGIGPQHVQFIGSQLNDPAKVSILARRMRGMTAKEEADLGKPSDRAQTLIDAGLKPGTPEFQEGMRRFVEHDLYRAPTEAGQLPADVRTAQWYASATPAQKEAFDKANGKGGGGKVAHVLTDNAGNVRFFTDTGTEVTPKSSTGAPVAPKGKPSATFEKTAALRQQLTADIDRTIPELEEITKDGGLIDQSTGSGIGRTVDWLARGAGVATPGDIAISRLQPIADMVLKMVPRFEGPQSDKDTQSYKEAAGQLADSSLPTEIRKAAGKEILRIMKARKGQFVSAAMEAEGMAAPGAGGDDPVSKADALLSKYPGK